MFMVMVRWFLVEEDSIIRGLLDAGHLKRPGNGFRVSRLSEYPEIGLKGF